LLLTRDPPAHPCHHPSPEPPSRRSTAASGGCRAVDQSAPSHDARRVQPRAPSAPRVSPCHCGPSPHPLRPPLATPPPRSYDPKTKTRFWCAPRGPAPQPGSPPPAAAAAPPAPALPPRASPPHAAPCYPTNAARARPLLLCIYPPSPPSRPKGLCVVHHLVRGALAPRQRRRPRAGAGRGLRHPAVQPEAAGEVVGAIGSGSVGARPRSQGRGDAPTSMCSGRFRAARAQPGAPRPPTAAPLAAPTPPPPNRPPPGLQLPADGQPARRPAAADRADGGGAGGPGVCRDPQVCGRGGRGHPCLVQGSCIGRRV
jgi:hypothetical protein